MTKSSASAASLSFSRFVAMFAKEFTQLKRDRITFATMIIVPLMQLFLFGFAINMNPRYLPTAVLVQEQTDVSRAIVAALQNTAYFKVTHIARTPLEMDQWIKSGEILFGVEIPVNFARDVRRGEKPSMLCGKNVLHWQHCRLLRRVIRQGKSTSSSLHCQHPLLFRVRRSRRL